MERAGASGRAALSRPEEGELLVVVGPTATGKTELAIELCRAWDGEIVSADSVQIYTRFDVGSGKPTAAERETARHHLIDAVEPTEAIDAAQFAAMADAAIADVRSRGRLPIVCGGTFLWIKALLFGLAKMPAADPAIRSRHAEQAEREGRESLHRLLRVHDPDAADRLAPNDFVRVSRALEVWELTGRTQTSWHAAHGFAEPRYTARLVGRHHERDELDRRIEARTRKWLAEGWIAEVEQLREDGYRRTRAMASVGYREVLAHVEGELPRDDLELAIVRATRRFVRRQRTWLRDEPVTWV